jgi:hypothetical protein
MQSNWRANKKKDFIPPKQLADPNIVEEYRKYFPKFSRKIKTFGKPKCNLNFIKPLI